MDVCSGTLHTVNVSLLNRLLQLEREAQKHKDLAMFPGSSSLPESEHLLYQLGWAEDSFSYHYLLRTKDRCVNIHHHIVLVGTAPGGAQCGHNLHELGIHVHTHLG